MGLEVIGAGLGRTGTLSLKLALELIGFGPCYHMTEMLAGVRRNVPLWIEAADGNPDWDAIFEGYLSTTDYPACVYWRQLADYYPDAKVILTTRDPDSWFDSVSETVFSEPHRARFSGGPLSEFFDRIVYADFGDRIADRAFMTEYFRRWNQSVIDGLPPERLLVYSARDGWEPLCAFLDVPVPAVPYPRVNSREDMTGRTGDLEINGPEDFERFARAYVQRLRAEAFGEDAAI